MKTRRNDEEQEQSPKLRRKLNGFELQEFPNEMLLEIFHYLDAVSLTQCSLVCKSFNEQVYDENLWDNVFGDKEYVYEEYEYEKIDESVTIRELYCHNHVTERLLSPLLRRTWIINVDEQVRGNETLQLEPLEYNTFIPISKQGGTPYVDEQYPWPICQCGYKLTLLMQLDCSEMERNSSIFKPQKLIEKDGIFYYQRDLIQIFACCALSLSPDKLLPDKPACTRYNHLVRKITIHIPRDDQIPDDQRELTKKPEDVVVLPFRIILSFTPKFDLPRIYEHYRQLVNYNKVKNLLFEPDQNLLQYLTQKFQSVKEEYLCTQLKEARRVVLNMAQIFCDTELTKKQKKSNLWDTNESFECLQRDKLDGYEQWVQPDVVRGECKTCNSETKMIIAMESNKHYWFGKNTGFGYVTICNCPDSLNIDWEH
jgi:hypothetical protein